MLTASAAQASEEAADLKAKLAGTQASAAEKEKSLGVMPPATELF